MYKAVFLDRDGVINQLIERADGNLTAPWNIDEFILLDGVQIAAHNLKLAGFKLFVVTNQPDVQSGYLPYEHLQQMNDKIKKLLLIDKVLFCEYRNSSYYKPSNLMIENLIENEAIDRSKSWMIGDRWKDIVPGHKSKLRTIFIGEDYTYPFEYKDITPDFKVGSLLEASRLIMENDND